MSVVVRMIGRRWFPSGEISSLMMHERTWGRVLSIVANWMTVDCQDIVKSYVNLWGDSLTYHFDEGFLEIALRGWRTSVEGMETWRLSRCYRSACQIDDGTKPRSSLGRNRSQDGRDYAYPSFSDMRMGFKV